MLTQIDHILDELVVQISDNSEQMTEYMKKLLNAMKYDVPYTAADLMDELEMKSKASFRNHYLHPAMELGLIEMTIPEKPNSRNQRYKKV